MSLYSERLDPKSAKALLVRLGLREFDRDNEFALFEDPEGDLRYVPISIKDDTLLSELIWALEGLGIERSAIFHEYQRHTNSQ